MSISVHILGGPLRDNAVILKVNSGTKYYRLLFDCGEGIFRGMPNSEVQQIDHLFFSHLHLDHASGFDYFFRRNYDRPAKPVYVYGPEHTIKAMHNRMQGYTWNLVEGINGRWVVTDITNDKLISTEFFASDGFAKKSNEQKRGFSGVALETEDFTVKVSLLNHIIDSAGYAVEEKEKVNIRKDELEATGLQPGAWLEKLKDESFMEDTIEIEGKVRSLKELREKLLYRTKGIKITYLTDFLPDEEGKKAAVELAEGSDLLICESQYLQEDEELAKKNYHLTSKDAAGIAKNAGVKELVLFHISDRYKYPEEFEKLLDEAREIFPATRFPHEWVDGI